MLKRAKLAALLPSRSGKPDPSLPRRRSLPTTTCPARSRTPPRLFPAPDPHGEPPEAIDEAEEEAAAAPRPRHRRQPLRLRRAELGEHGRRGAPPAAEAGEGEAEGLEQAEAELADNATYRDAAPSDAERQIDEAIEQAEQPQSGETPEPLASESGEQEPDKPSRS